ncbi:hypothetical protein DM01DRAFT_1331451 [Hesseltinella vesiculosa]|uniref:NAD(P)-binding domain-containing protein n=1 Tax=Hesseltinella vesiculosa TaxID=101127 RepID=A0A1X2GVB3_9FUNG|nr:hypothetical protein DM01DRAFT_1331451 [Hesseltinella vesiculosa]
MVRNIQKLPEDIKANVQVFEGQLTEDDVILTSLDGVDAVISALGPVFPGHPTGLPITIGYRHIFRCMREKNITRILALSTPSLVDKANDKRLWWGTFGILPIKFFFQNGYKDIVATGELFQEQSDLDWTLYRVVGLMDSKEESGKLKVSYGGDAGMWLYRKDIARFCINEVVENKWVHKLPLLSSDS